MSNTAAAKVEFIGYTIGLECNGHGMIGKMIKVEFNRLPDGGVKMQAVSGHNFSRRPGTRSVTADEFSNRPADPYDDAKTAAWALNLCGWSLMIDDYNDAQA